MVMYFQGIEYLKSETIESIYKILVGAGYEMPVYRLASNLPFSCFQSFLTVYQLSYMVQYFFSLAVS